VQLRAAVTRQAQVGLVLDVVGDDGETAAARRIVVKNPVARDRSDSDSDRNPAFEIGFAGPFR